MVKVNLRGNEGFQKLGETYGFNEPYPENQSGKPILNLGLGDSYYPITTEVIEHGKKSLELQLDEETFRGYPDENSGNHLTLKKLILERIYNQTNVLDVSELFLSQGAKNETAIVTNFFSSPSSALIPTPVYPVYEFSNKFSLNKITYLPFNKENNFFYDVIEDKENLIDEDDSYLIYLCNPNNPTGTVLNREQLKSYVDFAMKSKSLIVYDPAYSCFIREENIPKSIYEIEGATECAIEIGSFSKSSSFTGMRAGWTVIPKKIETDQGNLNELFQQYRSFTENGLSVLSTDLAIGSLELESIKKYNEYTNIYLNNSKKVLDYFNGKDGFEPFGGRNSPYVFIKLPSNLNNIDGNNENLGLIFRNKAMRKEGIKITHGSTFGEEGKNYFRISCFTSPKIIDEAIERFELLIK